MCNLYPQRIGVSEIALSKLTSTSELLVYLLGYDRSDESVELIDTVCKMIDLVVSRDTPAFKSQILKTVNVLLHVCMGANLLSYIVNVISFRGGKPNFSRT